MRDLRRRGLIIMSLSSFLFGWLNGAKAVDRRFRDIGRLRDYVMAALVKEKGVSNVRRHPSSEEKILYNIDKIKTEMDLTNLFNYINTYPEDGVDVTISRWIQSSREKNAKTGVDFIPVVRTAPYIADISKLNPDVLVDPFLSGLQIIYMVDRPNSVSPVSLGEFPGKTAGDIRKEAYDNLRRSLNKIVSDDISGLGMLYYVEGNTMLSPSLILLNEFWESIKPRFPNDTLIAIPRRDQLFIFHDTVDGRSIARKMIKVTLDEDYGVLSSALYARRGGKIIAVDR